jgi:peptide/nickel transport system substrate-binding protein
VGTGPYRLQEWLGGSQAVVVANDQYVLGKPRIDEIEVKFIADPNTLMANALAGAIDVTLGRGLSIDQGVMIRDQWREGKAEVQTRNWLMMYPQFLNPSPVVVTDLRFRRAVMHAIDRQQMADSISAGVVPVAHSFVSPAAPEYRDIEASIVRYDYDPRRASELLEDIGYVRGGDGGLRDGSGTRLALEVWTTGENDIHRKSILPVADYLQRVGIPVEPLVIPLQRANDRGYRANFPGLFLWRQPYNPASLSRYHSSITPLPENNYVGNNYARYYNAEWDNIIDRYLSTIPKAERTKVVAEAVRHSTENLNLMGLIFDGDPMLISARMIDAGPSRVDDSICVWNVERWDVRQR